jgi:hypothetical protein
MLFNFEMLIIFIIFEKNINMAILKYIPPTKKIVDNRNPNGGFYEAKCEVCGTDFYPTRSSAKYCTPNCGLIAHRIAVANGTAGKRKPAKVKVAKDPSVKEFRGMEAVYEYLSQRFNTSKQKGTILDDLKSLDIGEVWDYKTVHILKVSSQVYHVG